MSHTIRTAGGAAVTVSFGRPSNMSADPRAPSSQSHTPHTACVTPPYCKCNTSVKSEAKPETPARPYDYETEGLGGT
jgi:hypothetical protein